MTAIQQITAVAASLGWEVKTDIQKKKRVEFEFQRYTKMGAEFLFHGRHERQRYRQPYQRNRGLLREL